MLYNNFYYKFSAFFLIVFSTTSGGIYAEDIKKKVSEDVLYSLKECVNRNSFFKGTSSQESIEAFSIYCSKKFRRSYEFPLALFSFTKKADLPQNRGWAVKILTPVKHESRVKNLLAWLKKKYTPRKDIKFFYMPNEPYCEGYRTKKETQEQIADFLNTCPLLISCNHPDLLWTKKAVLIPDDYILAPTFHDDMQALLKSDFFEGDFTPGEKNLFPFCKRKSAVFFRGLLTGPSLPLSFKNSSENPRHYLVRHLYDFPYVDFGITRHIDYNIDKNYEEYLAQSFSYLKCDPVDFFEHAKNKYLLSFDGFGAAWSRVELIMATGSVLFLNAQCEQYFYPLMEKNKTHVVINKDLSNLALEFYRLEAAPEEAQKIGAQGREFARKFFTQEAIDAYLWLILYELEAQL